MIPSVYVETSIVSYLSAKPSRDVVIAAHQELTRRWWKGRDSYKLFVSQHETKGPHHRGATSGSGEYR